MISLKGKQRRKLLIDLGTASVTMALVEVGVDKKPNIIRLYRRYHLPSLKKGSADFQRHVLKHMGDLLGATEREFPEFCPEEVHIGLAAPFYKAETLPVIKRYDERHVFTDGDVKDVISAGADQFLSHFHSPSSVAIFEMQLLKSQINGYETAAAIGRKGNEMTLSVRYAGAHQLFLEELRSMIRRFHCTVGVELHTFPPLYAELVKPMITSEGVQLIIDIGGELTEIVYMRHGIIENVYTLPVGVMDITEEISRIFAVDYASGVTIYKKYVLEKLAQTDYAKVDEVLRNTVITWKDRFETVMRELPMIDQKRMLIFIIGGGAVMSDVKALLMSLPSLERIRNTMKLYTVEPEAFQEQFGGKDQLEGPQDLGILSLLLAAGPAMMKTTP